MTKISLLYTTARPHLVETIKGHWNKMAKDPDSLEWIIVTSDEADTCVKGWNLCAQRATGDIFVQVSDDTFILNNSWDSKIKMNMNISKPMMLRVWDNRYDICKTAFHPIITRKAYEELGYFYYPEYESMYCDDDITTLYRLKGWLVECPKIRIEHKHRTTHESVIVDSITMEHESRDRYNRGRAVFERRLRAWNLIK